MAGRFEGLNDEMWFVLEKLLSPVLRAMADRSLTLAMTVLLIIPPIPISETGEAVF